MKPIRPNLILNRRCTMHSLWLVACINLFAIPQTGICAATITETRQIIKTYPFSDPDPVPILARKGFNGGPCPIYPYGAFDGFSKTAVYREWTVIKMENPYIEIFVLPEVGGKVWGAREKATGREFLYLNHVLKFRQIALRGPWLSGGLEFNFGVIGHTPTSSTPVDYLTRTNPDGSVSCVVGTIDLPSRTRWSVTITLPKDKAYFETRAFWYNPTPFSQSYYTWMNAAVRVGDDLQYSFPGNAWIGHSFNESPAPWPVEGGRDLSWYRNNNFGSYKSYFTLGAALDFYGVYWHGARFGSGHWAGGGDAPGRKVWIWGLSREGMIWENLLTDRDGQYSEVQSGRYLNQSDTAFFQPGAADRWSELWFPFKETGPISAASPLGVLNVTTSPQALSLRLCPLQAIDDDLVVTDAGQEIHRERLHLAPMQVWKKEIHLTNGAGKIHLSLGPTLSWSSDPDAVLLKRPIHFHEIDESTPEGLYQSAERLAAGRKFTAALEKYLACLAKEPRHVRALGRVAELYLRRAEGDKALEYARRALDTDMYDPAANFIYALIARRRGDLTDAREALGWAARSMEYRSAAYSQLAELDILEKQYARAAEDARRALDFNTENMNARQALAIAYRKLQHPEKARSELNQILELEPLSHGARFEAWLLDPTPARLKAFQSMIRTEFPTETYLELAVYYSSLGLDDEAVRLLRLAPQASASPEVNYWLAWLLRERDPVESARLLIRAGALSPRLVFPFRPESIPVFEWAEKQNPADWKPRYYGALILWGVGRTDEAQTLLARCGEPDFAPLDLIRGQFVAKTNPRQAEAFYRQALATDRREWRAWHALLATLDAQETRTSETLALAREAAAAFPQQDEIRLDLSKALLHAGHADEALAALEQSPFLPFEGASDVHRLYVLCHLHATVARMRAGDYSSALQHIAAARKFPERLGTGRPYDPDLRAQDYFQSLCLEKMGRAEDACKLRRAIVQATLDQFKSGGEFKYFGGLALAREGEHEKAQPLLDRARLSRELRGLVESLDERGRL